MGNFQHVLMNPPTFGNQPSKVLSFSASSLVVLGGIFARKDKKSDPSSFVRPPGFPFTKESNSEGASQAKENDVSFCSEREMSLSPGSSSRPN